MTDFQIFGDNAFVRRKFIKRVLLERCQLTKNEIYFADLSGKPLFGGVDCKIPRRLDVAITKIPDIIKIIPPLPGALEATVHNIFAVVDTLKSPQDIYEDTRVDTGDFFIKVAENQYSCILKSLERPKEWRLMRKSEETYRRLT